MSAALDFTYRYPFASGLGTANGARPALTLATCNHDHASPHFFDGRARAPKIMADMLLTLSDIVRTNFFIPRPANLDPVLTSNERLLRLEGFSGCCGVYARVDLPADAFEGACHGRGTTNVDFNSPMREALSRIRDSDDVDFAVGRDDVTLSAGGNTVVEKKVRLPVRWIKCFSEVQSYQPRLDLRLETSAAEALRFIRSLPKTGGPKQPTFVMASGKSIRSSLRPQKGAIQVQGTHRVRVIEPLLLRAERLRVWADDDSGISAWEVCFGTGSFFAMISPEPYRGFSGEGQVLSNLSARPSDETIARVRAQLNWQSEIDLEALSAELELPMREVDSALAVLGSRGLAGYDACVGRHFHRELPFDLDAVEALQPRLAGARALVSDGGIVRTDHAGEEETAYRVPGSGTFHRVVLNDENDTCTCPWFSRYLGHRGPCKHILAARLTHEENEYGRPS